MLIYNIFVCDCVYLICIICTEPKSAKKGGKASCLCSTSNSPYNFGTTSISDMSDRVSNTSQESCDRSKIVVNKKRKNVLYQIDLIVPAGVAVLMLYVRLQEFSTACL